LSEHENQEHLSGEGTFKASFPKSFIVIIALILAGMLGFYYKADYINNPELIIEKYFSTQSTSDFTTEAQYLSVFVMAMQLPQYATLSGHELIQQRPLIEADYIKFSEDNSFPPADNMDIKISPFRQYTLTGKNSALVVFNALFENQDANMAASLIREPDGFKIINIIQVDLNDEVIQQSIKNFSIDETDEEYGAYMAE
jgi:hypothetical protein